MGSYAIVSETSTEEMERESSNNRRKKTRKEGEEGSELCIKLLCIQKCKQQ